MALLIVGPSTSSQTTVYSCYSQNETEGWSWLGVGRHRQASFVFGAKRRRCRRKLR